MSKGHGRDGVVRPRFEELDWRKTPMGELSLRRRVEPSLNMDVYEVKLGDEYLMSSLFTVAETELAKLGLAGLAGEGIDVVVGGLGLGYTARAVLRDERVRSMLVVEAQEAVIDWHERELLPQAAELNRDARNRFVMGDFFGLATDHTGFDAETPGRRFHAILVDIDHSPRHVLHPSHVDFYTVPGLHDLAAHLHPGGIFALWSDDQPDSGFTAILREVFTDVAAHVVAFHNPLVGETASNTVYTARLP